MIKALFIVLAVVIAIIAAGVLFVALLDYAGRDDDYKMMG
jgi:uncharacterized protein YxeA